jgi:hypothetical protein
MLRFLHIRILNLRPVLASFVAADLSDLEESQLFGIPLSYRLALQCSIVCVQNAQEAISTIQSRIADAPGVVGQLSEWWYNIMFIYTAATILIAARLHSAISTEIPNTSIMESWRQAIFVLKRYESFGVNVKRLLVALEILFQQVPGRYMRYRQQNHKEEPVCHDQGMLNPNETTGFQIQPSTSALDSNFSTQPVFPVAPDQLEHGYNFDFVFDPNDLSWLQSMPFNT